jgi:epoxyqueuosine reductase QueG
MLQELEDLARKQGISLFSVAPTPEEERKKFGLPLAIVLAVRLSNSCLERVVDRPTKPYLHHYKQVNYLLDRAALLLTNYIQEKGKDALPIPASQVIDWTEMKGDLSHKKMAHLAGIGFLGRQSLIVSPQFGARIRLVTILTDIELSPVGRPIDAGCGDCKACIKACPAGAIKDDVTDFDLSACRAQLDIFRKGIGQHICGICVKACRGQQ